MDLKKRMEFTLEVARSAGNISATYYGTDRLGTEYKGDESPVTAADRACEKFIRERLEAVYPEDGIVGEEFGVKKGTSDLTWYIDPIDGTQSFVTGVPFFATMIALETAGDSIMGVVHFPILNETVMAHKGGGTWWKRYNTEKFERCHVTKTKSLNQVRMTSSSINYWKQTKREPILYDVSKKVKWVHGWGDSFGQILVATGRLDLTLDPLMYDWDSMPLKPLVVEAGGVFTDFSGNPSPFGRSAFSCNPDLHSEVLKIIKAY
jgi:histidinol-phosphatase